MSNPILDQLNQKQFNNILPVIGKAKELMNNGTIDMVRGMIGNRDPKEVFYSECKRRNINPDDILKYLK